MLRKMLYFVVLCVLLNSALTVLAGSSETCPHANGAFYDSTVYPQLGDGWAYDLMQDGNVKFVLDPMVWRVRVANWSADCRYLVGFSVAERAWHLENETIMWDTLTGEQVARINGRPMNVHWQDDNSVAVIATESGSYIWSADSTLRPLVDATDTQLSHDILSYAFDTVPNQILITTRSNVGFVVGFDIDSGHEVIAFHNQDTAPVDYVMSDDNDHLIAYNPNKRNEQVTLWDCNSYFQVALNMNNSVVLSDKQITLSPDDRYVVVAGESLKIWDVTTLADNFADRLAKFEFDGPIAHVDEIRFVDNMTIETISASGIQQWNLLSGEEL